MSKVRKLSLPQVRDVMGAYGEEAEKYYRNTLDESAKERLAIAREKLSTMGVEPALLEEFESYVKKIVCGVVPLDEEKLGSFYHRIMENVLISAVWKCKADGITNLHVYNGDE